MSHKRVELDRNNSGHAFIGMTEVNDNDIPIRSSVIASGNKYTVDKIMKKRFHDLLAIARPEIEFVVTNDYLRGCK